MRHSITSPRLAGSRELIDTAIAVNEAPSVDAALQALASAAAPMLGAPLVVVVVWDAGLATGTVVAGGGEAESWVGAKIRSDRAAPAIAAEVAYAGRPMFPDMAARAPHVEWVVRVPLEVGGRRATITAGWPEPLDDDAAVEALELMDTLTRLTSVAERSLRVREQTRLDSLLDAVADGVVAGSPSGTQTNAAARAILGCPSPEDFDLARFNIRTLEGRPFSFSEPGYYPGKRAAANGESKRFRIRATALDGRELVLDGSVSPAGDSAIIVFRDVTDEHAREVLNERWLYHMFNSLPIPLTVGSINREVLSVNRAFLDLVGFDFDEVAGASPPFPWWGEHEDETAGFEPGTVVRRVFRRKDGRPVPVEVLSHGIPGDDGETALLLGVITDLSEKQRLDQQLVQSGKLAAIGELAAGVAHEINNPLFAILGLTEFLLKEAEPQSKAHQRLELIQQTGLEIKEIVRALLDFARENAEERHVVQLEDVVRSTVDLVRRTNAHKGVELVDEYDDSAALVCATPNQLKQIFLNLIANARQAMPNGGTVSVDVRREGDWVTATVSDDGEGIAPEVLERIFEPFFTTKRHSGGTGLGLSVSLGIAEAHGGSLTAASEPGVGTTFTLRLPVAEEITA